MIVGLYMIIPFLKKIVASEFLTKYFLVLSLIFAFVIPETVNIVMLISEKYGLFLKKYFDDKEKLIIPMKPLELESDPKELEALFCGNSFKEDYLVLNREIRNMGYNIPPLVNAYMGLSPTMKLFGTAINYGFGDVEETGILIAIDEIFEEKRKRHIDTFMVEHRDEIAITSGANKVIYKEGKD